MDPTQLTTAIRSLVLQAATAELNSDEQLQLEAALDILMDQPIDVEESIVSQVLDDVYDVPDAGDIFLSELEIQSELAFLGERVDQAALLICLPVIFMAGDTPQRLARSTDDMLGIAHVLTATDVVDSQAQVALLPRLFRPEELVTQSYSTLRDMTRLMGTQLLEGDPVRLLPGVMADGIKTSEHFAWGDNAYIDLRFLIGVVLTHESALDEVFPEVGRDSTEGEIARMDQLVLEDEADDDEAEEFDDEGHRKPATPGEGAWGERPAPTPPFEAPTIASLLGENNAPGLTADGRWWEIPFLDAVDDAFSPMFGSQGSTLPDDFHEGLRNGLELWRRSGLRHQVRQAFAENEAVLLHARAYQDKVTSRYGWDIILVGEDGTVRDQSPWEVLLHEHPDDAEDSLRSACEARNWTLVELQPVEALN